MERWSGGGGGQRSRDKINHHHHVLHVCHLGDFLHVPWVGHLRNVIVFLSILYNSGLLQLEGGR